MTSRRSGEALVFTGAFALVHALDDAFVHRGPGLGQHALAGLIAIGAGTAGVVAYPSLRPGLRAAHAFSFGGLALVNGMLHVIHVGEHGAAGGDVTGVLAAAGGACSSGWPSRSRGGAAARVRGRRVPWPCPPSCLA
jgi:hypothetical protein